MLVGGVEGIMNLRIGQFARQIPRNRQTPFIALWYLRMDSFDALDIFQEKTSKKWTRDISEILVSILTKHFS